MKHTAHRFIHMGSVNGKTWVSGNIPVELEWFQEIERNCGNWVYFREYREDKLHILEEDGDSSLKF